MALHEDLTELAAELEQIKQKLRVMHARFTETEIRCEDLEASIQSAKALALQKAVKAADMFKKRVDVRRRVG
jgi:hypothetical protein